MWCKWCGDPISKVINGKSSTQRMWHPECYAEYDLHTRANTQYNYLVNRHGEFCQACPAGTPPPRKWIIDKQQRRICKQTFWLGEPEDYPEYWDQPEKPWHELSADERMVGQQCDCRLEIALEVDHIVPLWSVAHLPDEQRRPYFGPINLQLLCPKHHKEKTKREAALRAKMKREGKL